MPRLRLFLEVLRRGASTRTTTWWCIATSSRGNILVTDDGRVKLLDFGIAKLLNPGLSAVAQPVTRTELRLMTPEYASP